MIDIEYNDQSKGSLRITGKRERIIRYHKIVYAYPKGVIDLEELTVILQHSPINVSDLSKIKATQEAMVVVTSKGFGEEISNVLSGRNLVQLDFA